MKSTEESPKNSPKEKKADIGMIGLGVMGANLARNMCSAGFFVAAYDLDKEKAVRLAAGSCDTMQDSWGGDSCGKGKITAAASLKELTEKLAPPRKFFIMVNAGSPVDEVIGELLPLISKGDIIIDGGNSDFRDTMRREKNLSAKGILFVGCGVSGGAEGALHGASLMPGGNPSAWPEIKPVLQAICASADRKLCKEEENADARLCCDWIGEGGAGHFVKMVHNGIEYGDMQLICEVWHLLKHICKADSEDMHRIFSDWNKTKLSSYLIEITADIFSVKDHDETPLIDKILDCAGQKGTGRWTGITALEENVPLTLITEAVYARSLSAMKEERTKAAELYKKTETDEAIGAREELVETIRRALYAARIISYAQGFSLMHAASAHYEWKLNYADIARIWRGGCIIRSALLEKIMDAFRENPETGNLLLSPGISAEISGYIPSLREAVTEAVTKGVPAPALTSALEYFDAYTSETLPAGLLQAQRDYFGAHTYERTDAPRGTRFHTEWKEDIRWKTENMM